MIICWVTNDKWYSRLLRWIFREPTSHVGVVFNIDGIELTVDLNRPYGSVWATNYWLRKYNVVWKATVELSDEQEKKLYKECESYAVNRPYDINGYYYGMFIGLLHRLFGVEYPERNKWSSHSGSMCQEIVVPILQSKIIRSQGVVSNIYDFSNKTPHMTMLYLKSITYNKEEWDWQFNG